MKSYGSVTGNLHLSSVVIRHTVRMRAAYVVCMCGMKVRGDGWVGKAPTFSFQVTPKAADEPSTHPWVRFHVCTADQSQLIYDLLIFFHVMKPRLQLWSLKLEEIVGMIFVG